MLIALCGDKGAPGVTTSALAIASAWPGPAVVVEASPAGGDLAIRLRPKGSVLPETPTVLSVVTASRGTDRTDAVANHSHVLNSTTHGGPRACPGGAVREHRRLGAAGRRPQPEPPCRCSPTSGTSMPRPRRSPSRPRADLVVVVSRPDMPSVVRVRERLIRAATDLARMRGTAPRLFPLLVSTSRHGRADVADLSAVLAETPARPFLVDAGFLAHDPAAVRRLQAGEEPAGRLARTALMRTARTVVGQIERIAKAPAHATAGSASKAGS